MNKFTIPAILLLASTSAIAQQSPWNSSPNNWDNSSANLQNSQHSWENSPANWANSKHNLESNRVVRDSSGKPIGYAVPKSDGGANFFDFDGNRKAYVAPK
jgi:hypothetical protein